jgi:hypothetical protein
MFLDLLTFFNYLCHEDSVSIRAIRKNKWPWPVLKYCPGSYEGKTISIIDSWPRFEPGTS